MNNQWRDNANAMVRWADGTYDRSRKCDSCNLHDCKTPVHTDFYKEIGHIIDGDLGEETSLGYWGFMHREQPLGSFMDFDGEAVTPEYHNANPDNLAETEARHSGVTEDQHKWIEEAYLQLTGKQKEVWNLVMREQVSQVLVAAQLKVSTQAVKQMLDRAKKSVEDYLQMKKTNESM